MTGQIDPTGQASQRVGEGEGDGASAPSGGQTGGQTRDPRRQAGAVDLPTYLDPDVEPCRGHHQRFTRAADAPKRLQPQLERQLVRRFCDECPLHLKQACLQQALDHRDDTLVRGGLTTSELRRLWRPGRHRSSPPVGLGLGHLVLPAPRGASDSTSATPAPSERQNKDPTINDTIQHSQDLTNQSDTSPEDSADRPEGDPQMDDDKALDKVRKLLTLAQRAATDQEAEAAFERAFALMEAHALTDQQVRDASPDSDPLTHAKVSLSSSTWRVDVTIAAFVARLCDCFVLRTDYSPGYPACVTFYGRRSHVDRAQVLLGSLIQQSNATAARRRQDWHGRGDVRKFVASVREGFVVALCRRLEARHAERAAPLAPGSGLVPISLRSEAQAYAQSLLSFRAARQSNRSVDSRGWALGQQDGRNASLGDAALSGRRGLGRGA